MRKKTLFSYAVAMTVVAASLILTGCDHDDYRYWDDWHYYDYHPYDGYHHGDGMMSDDDMVMMAQYLNAHWSGTLTALYADEDGNDVEDRFDIDWEFDQESADATHGRGQETTFVGGEEHGVRFFSWSIERDGDISMVYDDGVEMTIVYDEMTLTANQFTGVMEGVNIEETDVFTLSRSSLGRNAPARNHEVKVFGGKNAN